MEGKFEKNTVTLEDIRPRVKKGATEIPEGHVRLHYRRFDENYEGWGLHLWGEGYAGPPVTWGSPLPITGIDDYGAYWDIPYNEGVGDLNFIIHKGNIKDPQPDRTYPDPDKNKEIWCVSGEVKEFLNKEEALNAAGNKVVSAVIKDRRTIEVEFRSEISKPIYIRDGYDYVPLKKLDMSQAPVYVLTTREDLDYNKTYKIECGALEGKTILGPEAIDKAFAYDGELGALYKPEATTFKLWAPLATEVKLKLFKEGNDQKPYKIVPMNKGDKGVWSVTVAGDLLGEFYQYSVTNNGQTRNALDPYARSMAGFNSNGPDKVGKGAIVDLDLTDPEGWNQDDYVSIEDQEDVVIYEMSVRDFTISVDSGVDFEKKGTYLGFIDKIPHLKDLGITHVQLMPVLNFYYGNEFNKDFENIGSAGEANYNWGYDPHNYFTPEGWYSLDPSDPHLRIKELKTLIKALHDAGIGVVLDVVYNHTAKTSTFEDIVPNYYYRRNPDGSFTSGSGCGNDTASERAMMRKLIVDSTRYWVEEYHVDGFRFDLMGLHDETTMKKVASTLRSINPDVVLHGEGWNMGTLPVKDRYIKGAGAERSCLQMEHAIAVFNDGLRDALKHEYYASPLPEGGFVQRQKNKEPLIRSGIIAGMVDYTSPVLIDGNPYNRFADDPEETITYVTCHDGYTLWDKIVGSTPNATEEERKQMHKLAHAVILTSQGKPFIHGGAELLRSKPDPDNDRYGVDHNSYDSGDLTNQIDWSRKVKYADVYEYFKGLIELRKSHEAFRMETMEEIQKGLTFIEEDIPFLVAYRLEEQDGTDPWKEIVVIYNANKENKTVEVDGVDPSWKVVVDGDRAGVEPLAETEVVVRDGEVVVPPISCVVIHK
ncbi:pullulanase, type I [Halothermothrix orenii H 168]|uniref:pullulanase n=2 Tax=Halothermothrix orenii TaxID=31909 RepID=B8CZI3_HALOH|nr:pullulanase, type I [Halothermothrix orenii H 168]